MAYFSNGTEGELYRDHYCYRCENFPEDDESKDCPIWTAHLFHVSDASKIPEVKSILDLLIPMKNHTFKDGLTYPVAAECAFFRHRTEPLPFPPGEALR